MKVQKLLFHLQVFPFLVQRKLQIEAVQPLDLLSSQCLVAWIPINVSSERDF